MKLEKELKSHLLNYKKKFENKSFPKINRDVDILMDVFGITPENKTINRQYWGRELGYLWELLITSIAKYHVDYEEKPLWSGQSPCDFFIGNIAVDPKYRIGSGDSGTLKGWAADGAMLKSKGYLPTMLILREDNLPAAINRIKNDWNLLIGKDALDFIKIKLNFDMQSFLINLKNELEIELDL